MIVYQNNFENGFGGNVTVEGDTVIKSTGAGNSAAYFNGEGDGLRLTNSSLNLGSSDFSISFRMKTVGYQDAYSVLMDTGTGNWYSGTYSGILWFLNQEIGTQGGGFTGFSATSPVNLNDGNWHTLEMGRTNGQGFFNTDSLKTTSNLTETNSHAPIDLRNLRVGRWNGNDLTDNNFTGYIDDIKIETLDSQTITKPVSGTQQTISIPGLVNTGAGLSNGELDLNYKFTKIQGAANGASGYTFAVDQTNWSWISDSTTSHWLTPSANPRQSYDSDSYGLYKWTLEFDLSGYNPKTAAFSARVAADNSVQVKLNGQLLITAGETKGDSHTKFTEFSANSGFVNNKNSLEFIVKNLKVDVWNPTGLRVEFISSSIQKSGNSEPTGAVELSGDYTQGKTIYADGSQITDADGLGAFSYQWQRSADGKTWKNIGGASQDRYDLSTADVGQSVRVALRYTDGKGTAETVYSAASMTIAGSNHPPSGGISVTGLIQQEQMLAVDTQNLSDAEGLGSFSYQWLANGRNIAGATDSRYRLTETEVGKTISVNLSYTDGKGTAERVSSPETSPVLNINDAPSGAVTLNGRPELGQMLTANANLVDADGLGTFTYQWLANGQAVTGATASSYVLTRNEVGKVLSVRVSYTDGHGTPESMSSDASGPTANVNGAPGGTVSISGTAMQGQTLTVNPNLTDADGLGSFRYQWLADGTAIDKASGNTLVLTEAQVGKRISVAVSYTDGQGTAEQVSSAASAAVANVNDIPTGTVTINGKTQSGNVLTLSQNLVDADGLGFFSYEWLAGGKVVGTGDRYTLTAAEVGKTLGVTLHYTDGHGTAEQVSSAETGIVTATATLLKGTAGHDKWIGKAGDERFDGLAGNDTLSGLAGNDSLIGNTGNDSLDGGVGNDNLRGDAGNDILLGGSGDDSLDGGFDNDLLDGGNGNDTLQGGTGIDTLKGGEGNDLYFVDNFRDQIIEVAGALGGNDSVQSSRNYTLPANVENLLLTGLQNLTGTGNETANRITGNSGDNVLDGRNGNDALVGGNGDDTLIGGGGVDTLAGGDGSDTYQVSSMEDAIIENAKDGDQDVVESKVDYELGDNIEVLVLLDAALTGYGNGLDNVLVGTANANVLNGGDGDDSLQGEAGDDSLDGGTGDDTLDGGEGQDVVMYSGELSDYKITYDQDSQNWRVEDVNLADGQDDGTDTLTGVEMLALADQDYPLLVGVVSGEW